MNKYWFIDILKALGEFLKDVLSKKPIPPTPEPAPTTPPVVEVPTPPKPQTISIRESLYIVAKGNLGMDVTPHDEVDDDVDCADSLNTIYKITTGRPISTPGYSTIELYNAMMSDPKRFKKVDTPLPGTIIICVSGTGNGNLGHGHCGICGKVSIMSNTSATGKWQANYTFTSWEKYFSQFGGMRIHLFEPL